MSVTLIIVLILQASECSIKDDFRKNYEEPTLPRDPNPKTEDYESLLQQMNDKTTASGPANDANRFVVITTTTTLKRRTVPRRVSLEEECDYLAYYCLKAYKTGKVCGRTLYYNYQDFKNYCMLDYVNCMERYEVWQIAHMGECFEVTLLKEYQHYEYHDDFFLDQTYVIQD